METETLLDMGRSALMITLELSAPLLIVGLAVGLIVGLLQAATQVQDQTVSFVPKLVAMLAALALALPWMLARMFEYATQMFGQVPTGM